VNDKYTRTLWVTTDFVCHRFGTDFYACELLFDALLALVDNELYAFVDHVVVTHSKAQAFAAAIDGVEFDDQWEIHLHLLHLTQGQVDDFIEWLRQDDFTIEPV
jgi:hypothetical protein